MKDISPLKGARECVTSVNRSIRHLRDFSLIAEILLHHRVFQFRRSFRCLQRKRVDSHVASVRSIRRNTGIKCRTSRPDRSSVDLAADSGGVVSLRNRSFHPHRCLGARTSASVSLSARRERNRSLVRKPRKQSTRLASLVRPFVHFSQNWNSKWC